MIRLVERRSPAWRRRLEIDQGHDNVVGRYVGDELTHGFGFKNANAAGVWSDTGGAIVKPAC
jgi:hypothetical protein